MRFQQENAMGRNIGTWDRIGRFALGLFLLSLTIYPASPWGIFGLLPLTTSILGYCPLYRLLGVSSFARCLPGGSAQRQEQPR
jgi:hypothetical protein